MGSTVVAETRRAGLVSATGVDCRGVAAVIVAFWFCFGSGSAAAAAAAASAARDCIQ